MNKILKCNSVILSLIIIFTAFFNSTFSNVVAVTEKTGYIQSSKVRIRKDASTTSDVLTTLSGVFVYVIDSKSDVNKIKNPETEKIYKWYKIYYRASSEIFEGYVREDLIYISENQLSDVFVKNLKDFPESYHKDLIILHAQYPNWIFTADDVKYSLKESVAFQDNLFYKLVQSNYNSWRSMRKGCYNWSTDKFVQTDSGGWYGASREVIAYYMDPRNFLKSDSIFQYMQQTYEKETQNAKGVETILKDTFLWDSKNKSCVTIDDENDDFVGKTYAEVIIEAAKQSNVNPYVLASTIIQEQGRKGSTLSKGSIYKDKTVYNFFNYGASGSNSSEVIKNGLKYAYEKDWTSASKAIIEGAKLYASGYISVGQDTYFYKNYNVHNPNKVWHQYAQNVADSLNSSKILREAYAEFTELSLNFKIPVYAITPSKISALPEKSDKYNNYYINDIKIDGITPSFEKYTFEYSLSLDKDYTAKIQLPKGASLSSDSIFSLTKGENEVKLIVVSETGYKNVYTLNIEAQKNCKLFINTSANDDKDKNDTSKPQNSSSETPSQNSSSSASSSGNSSSTNSTVTEKPNSSQNSSSDSSSNTGSDKNSSGSSVSSNTSSTTNSDKNDDKPNKKIICGDTNGDGQITTSDLANIRLHLLKLIKLKGDNLKGADTNGDGNITTSDLANIRLHLLKLITLK